MTIQIAYSYSAARAAENHFRLAFAAFNGRLRERVTKIAGFDRWLVDTSPLPVAEAYPKESVVYLTADSDVVLERLERNTVRSLQGCLY